MTVEIHPKLLAEFNAMLPLQHMQARVLDYDGRRMRIAAPLAPNLNDKGTAFGGSMASLMTIGGWLLVSQNLMDDTCHPDVFVTESSSHFSRIVTTDMIATVWLAANSFESLALQMHRRGKVRVRTEAKIEGADGITGAVMSAVYAAIIK
ncbi:hypothetical protein G7069_03250 [Lysobacter sp. HDW10]|uniref:YiiD C-terminal domain-containing protein n=1 Tax=Lysobacter sp. HDW10 TaxID=2714936 RepID=UPI00140E8D5B|nr:YiiD C-terminal domain-containing protein [Lysobacter sp. HDW10]QIK80701.1 hypothetical protein G7069_03250 [Lysobacter sp. HDW10]